MASNPKRQKWFHAIGGSGHATSNVAKLFKEMGWFVTASDSQFFPPASDVLRENEIHTDEGYSYAHLTKEFWEEKLGKSLPIGIHPDLSLLVSIQTKNNKEYRYAKLKKLDVRPFAKILGEYLVKPESVVVVGTAGKTTVTALIIYLMQLLDLDPSFMVGAPAKNLTTQIKNTKSNWSVLEGDEYHNPDKHIEGHAKFLEFKPKYLLITNIGWEHQDIFQTREAYIAEFKKAVQLVPADGFIIAKAYDAEVNEIVKEAVCPVIRYSFSKVLQGDTFYYAQGDSQKFTLYKNDVILFESSTSLLGTYNIENIVAAVALIYELVERQRIQLDLEKTPAFFKKVLPAFMGISKRLEVLFNSAKVTVIDDFGVAPLRAKNSLKTIRHLYPKSIIIAVFEPNSGGRFADEAVFKTNYQDVFYNATEVVIPELSRAQKGLSTEDEFEKWLRDLDVSVKHVPSLLLSQYLRDRVASHKMHTVVIFFSSYRLTEIARNLF